MTRTLYWHVYVCVRVHVCTVFCWIDFYSMKMLMTHLETQMQQPLVKVMGRVNTKMERQQKGTFFMQRDIKKNKSVEDRNMSIKILYSCSWFLGHWSFALLLPKALAFSLLFSLCYPYFHALLINIPLHSPF